MDGTVDLSPDDIETKLIDLNGIPVSALRTCDDDVLAQSMKRVLVEVERPRANIGSGPPGRVD